MESSDPLMLALTTEADAARAKALSASVLEQGLAACISLLPVTSLYHWNGELCDEAEVQLLIKPRRSLLDDLEQAVLERHSYDLPEWICWPVGSSVAYSTWAGEQLRPSPNQEDAEPQAP